MLNELCIRNFAIIDHLSLQFGPGLNILTGETGAGKSIIIDAVGLLLGDRAAVEWVRTGAEMASIEATFSVRPDSAIGSELDTMLEEQALDDPDSRGWLVLTREVRRNGRNVCRVNGRTVNLQTLSDIANVLIDVHGQGEHLSLLRPKTHIHLLDHFAGLLPLRAQLAHHVGELRSVQRQLRHLRQDARMIAQRIDLLSFQAEEIRAANLRVGEDQELESERRRLGNAEALTTLAQTVHTILNQGDGEMPSAADLLGEAVGKLEKLARIDPDMTVTANEAQVLLEQLTDLARGLQDYTDTLEFNPERLQEVEERAELITGLRRKYGDTIEQICGFGEQAAAELAEIANWEVRTADLEVQEDKLLHTIGRLAAELTEKRRSAGEKLAAHVEMELSELNMNRARFGVSIEQVEQTEGAHLPDGRRVAFDGTGVDQVEFLITANPGEPLKPMARVASGGETARLMLALKSTLAHADATPTLIFDEIDQGIGGRIGGIVGQKLWHLTNQSSAPHQVLCITHLPQLAVFGDDHFTVSKRILAVDGAERTTTEVKALAGDERVFELMQMLGATSDAGRLSVEEMMLNVTEVKLGGRAI